MMPDFYAPNLSPADMTGLRTWVLDDGRAGHLNQSVGVVEALGVKHYDIIPLQPSPLKALWKILYAPKAYTLPAKFLAGPKPELIVATGWQNSIQVRALKRLYPDAFTVQMMRPSGHLGSYDVVAVPIHNTLKNMPAMDNIVTTIGAPNRIAEGKLKGEAQRWQSRLQDVPKPRLAVLIGGETKGFPFGEAELEAMLAPAIQVAQDKKYGLLVTTSRRTPDALREKARRMLQAAKVAHYFWAGDDPLQRDNPYLAFLATAEAVVVGADSISMISESCSANKAVYVWGMSRMQQGKFHTFYEVLEKQHRIMAWENALTDRNALPLRPPPYPLADTHMVAGFIQGKWAKRLSSKVRG